MNKAVATN